MCRYAAQDYTPHFLFETSKRKCAVHGGKEKMFRDELAHEGPTHPKRGADRYALPTKSRSFLPAALKVPKWPECVPAFAGMAFVGSQRGHPLLLSPLPLPLILREVSKGEGRSPPLCRFKGVRGEIEIPPRFSLGGRGDILFSKENIPLASPYRSGTVPPGTPVIFSARRKENGDSIRCGIAAHLRTNLVRLTSQFDNSKEK